MVSISVRLIRCVHVSTESGPVLILNDEAAEHSDREQKRHPEQDKAELASPAMKEVSHSNLSWRPSIPRDRALSTSLGSLREFNLQCLPW